MILLFYFIMKYFVNSIHILKKIKCLEKCCQYLDLYWRQSTAWKNVPVTEMTGVGVGRLVELNYGNCYSHKLRNFLRNFLDFNRNIQNINLLYFLITGSLITGSGLQTKRYAKNNKQLLKYSKVPRYGREMLSNLT